MTTSLVLGGLDTFPATPPTTSSSSAPASRTGATRSTGSTRAHRTRSTCGASVGAGRSAPATSPRWSRSSRPALLPGHRLRTTPAFHPYTTDGLQVDVAAATDWVEVGECGLAHPELLAAHRLPPVRWSGLAMGLGLDRILMLRKGIPDIRLLRSDHRVARQLLDLAPYRPVSTRPPVLRDLSVALDDADVAEDLGDRVREALGDDADAVEAVELVATTAGDTLSAVARERLGLRPGQGNTLVRVTLRHPTRALRHDEANTLRDRVWAALHRGSAHQWASGSP